MEVLLFWKLVLALLLGTLIGAEREYHKKGAGIGIRTTAFFCLFGAMISYFSIFFDSPIMFVLGLIFASGFGISMFWYRAKKYNHIGLTTSVVILLTYFIGAMIAFDLFQEAITSAVMIFVLLFTKKHLVDKIKHLNEGEVFNAIEFAIIAFVIYPFLPDQTFFYINIKQAWWTVILISLISFLGFISMRKLGEAKGTLVTSLFGGIVSTDATIIEIIRHYKKNRSMIKLFTLSAMITVLILIFRNAAISAAVAGDIGMFLNFWKYFAVTGAFSLILIIYLGMSIPKKTRKTKHDINLEMPFAIKPALYFGLIFMGIFAFSEYMVSNFSSSYTMPISLLGGMASSMATTASYSLLYVNGTIGTATLVQSVVLATIGSMLLEVIVLYAANEKRFAHHVVKYILILAALLGICMII